MSTFKLDSFPNRPKKLKRRKTGTLELHKSNNRTNYFSPGTISNSSQILAFPKIPNYDIDSSKEENTKIDLNLSVNSFEFTFQYPNKPDSFKCSQVSSVTAPKEVDDGNILQGTGVTQRRVKSIMKKSKIEDKKIIAAETYKKVSFLEGRLTEITNSLNGTSKDIRGADDDADIRNKQSPTKNKDIVNSLISNPAIVNVIENVTIWKDESDMKSDFNRASVINKISDKNLPPQNSLVDCTIQLSPEDKSCNSITDSELQEIFEPQIDCPKEPSLLQNLFDPDDYLNEIKHFNGSSIYSSNESTNTELPYNKTKVLYDQEIKILDSAIRDLKIQRKKLAMKRRATVWNSFFWFTMPGKEKLIKHHDKKNGITATSNKYSEEKMASDLKTQRKYIGFLSYRLSTKAKNYAGNFKNEVP